MYKDKISLTTARELERTGHITIVDASPESLTPIGHAGIEWKQNFKTLQEKNRQISPDKILSFYNAKYSIEDIREFNHISELLIEKAKDEKIFNAISDAFKNQIEFDGGTSWNRYEFFIGWLLMQGSEIFNFGLSAPNSLKDLINNIYSNDLTKCSCEEAIFIASSAYEIKTGRDYFEDF